MNLQLKHEESAKRTSGHTLLTGQWPAKLHKQQDTESLIQGMRTGKNRGVLRADEELQIW